MVCKRQIGYERKEIYLLIDDFSYISASSGATSKKEGNLNFKKIWSNRKNKKNVCVYMMYKHIEVVIISI